MIGGGTAAAAPTCNKNIVLTQPTCVGLPLEDTCRPRIFADDLSFHCINKNIVIKFLNIPLQNTH